MVPATFFHSGPELLAVPFFHPENKYVYFMPVRDYLVHCYHPGRELPCLKSFPPQEHTLPYVNAGRFDKFFNLYETTVKSGAINHSEGLYYFMNN